MSVYQRIKEVRTEANKTQEVFANELNMRRDNYAKLEAGNVNPSLDVLNIIHNIYGTNLNWLVCGSGKKRINEVWVEATVSKTENFNWKEIAEERKERIEELKAKVTGLEKALEDSKTK